jgi:hypothetical protein
MEMRIAAFGIGLALALTPPGVLAAEEVARILGVAIDRSELRAAGDGEEAQLSRLYDRVWGGVSRHYIERHRLNATPQEIAELTDYEREFDSKDRAQRARKLVELDHRLAAQDLPVEERARLLEFRDTLERLARSDAAADKDPPPDAALESARRAQWIELWKLNRALYEEYGGTVALTRFGPFPHGARLALLEDYERRGLLEFADGRLRERLMAVLAASPPIPLAEGQVDFTPYWKRPIPSSYFPD